MKDKYIVALLALCGLLAFIPFGAEISNNRYIGSAHSRSPESGYAIVIQEIDKAKSEIFIQAYPLNAIPLIQAIRNAKGRGVRVEAILDGGTPDGWVSQEDINRHLQTKTYLDRQHSTPLKKAIIIDKSTLIMESFTANQQGSPQLLVASQNRSLLNEYIHSYQVHKKHSKSYEPN